MAQLHDRYIIIIFIYCNWVVPGGSGYFTCIQNMKLVITEFKSGGLHEKHVVATWNLGNHLSICFEAQGNQDDDDDDDDVSSLSG